MKLGEVHVALQADHVCAIDRRVPHDGVDEYDKTDTPVRLRGAKSEALCLDRHPQVQVESLVCLHDVQATAADAQ